MLEYDLKGKLFFYFRILFEIFNFTFLPPTHTHHTTLPPNVGKLNIFGS